MEVAARLWLRGGGWAMRAIDGTLPGGRSHKVIQGDARTFGADRIRAHQRSIEGDNGDTSGEDRRAVKIDRAEQGKQVTLSGEFTFNDNEAFRQLLNTLAEQPKTAFVLDVSGVTFMDSAAIGMLLLARDELERVGSRIIIHKPQGQVRRVLDVAQMSQLFEMRD
jgi:anti-anti-sigma factor